MDKASFIEQLYHDLKDDIEFDEDIRALSSILKELIKIDENKSINNWIFIMTKYKWNKLNKDIDFSPLVTDFIVEVLKNNSIKKIFEILQPLPLNNQQLIKDQFFNVFDLNSGINQYLKNLINDKMKNNNQIFLEIKLILNYSKNLNKLIFDEEFFLKNVIKMYLEQPEKDIAFLLKIIELTKDNKNKALLKTLLIDYI
ncbi:unknown [Mycoplasma sp. CAG:776]|nr:unknown [Mycoplasma sp. CAG:776]